MFRRRTALLAVGCVTLALPAVAAARTKVVYAGGPAKFGQMLEQRYGAGVNNFLINRVTIHVGDSVAWNGASLAHGFHTVDIPKLNGSDLALLTSTGHAVTGADDASGKPFWFDGKVPALSFNPLLAPRSDGGVYTGTHRLESGLPIGPPKDFKVKFTTPGIYKYYCDIHPGMVGYVVVKAKRAAVPSSRQDAQTLKREELRFIGEAKAGDRGKVTGNRVSLGVSKPGGLEIFAMFPVKLTVKPGTTVRFFMPRGTTETHTASFGPAKYLIDLSNSIASPFPAPAAVYPSDPPGHTTLGPASHGNGFANTGALDRDSGTPLPASGSIKFLKPGTYHFICLIHPFMHGTVVVK